MTMTQLVEALLWTTLVLQVLGTYLIHRKTRADRALIAAERSVLAAERFMLRIERVQLDAKRAALRAEKGRA